MQVVIPVSRDDIFFQKKDFFFSKPLVEVNGSAMIAVVAQNIQSNFPNERLIFVVDQNDIDDFTIDGVIKNSIDSKVEIVARSQPTSGALSSVLLSIDSLDPNEELLILNGDQIILSDIKEILLKFRNLKANAGVVTFKSSHPRWSYVLADENQNVMQVAEKKVISKHAIAGLYYFDCARRFIDSATKTMLDDNMLDGKFYISPTLNEIILNGGVVKNIEIPEENYHSFYSPSRVDLYENNFSMKENFKNEINLIIPAAGLGSRFSKDGWKKPKPFIDVGGDMMIEKVIKNVSPQNSNVQVLVQKEHRNYYKNLNSKNLNFFEIDTVTEGAACTVLLCREFIDSNFPLLIANSDQIVDFNVDYFIKDCYERSLDGSILVFKADDPKWSYAKLDSDGHVIEVAEKKVISNLATVGIYFFRRGDQFIKAAIDMIARNDRVNGEFYTCPVYNYLISSGKKIGVYEIDPSQMNGLGTPEDLLNYIAKTKLPSSQDAP